MGGVIWSVTALRLRTSQWHRSPRRWFTHHSMAVPCHPSTRSPNRCAWTSSEFAPVEPVHLCLSYTRGNEAEQQHQAAADRDADVTQVSDLREQTPRRVPARDRSSASRRAVMRGLRSRRFQPMPRAADIHSLQQRLTLTRGLAADLVSLVWRRLGTVVLRRLAA